MCSCEENFTASNFATFSRIEFSFFAMKFLEQKVLYVNNIFQVQNINTKKDIYNLSTCVVLRNNHRNYFNIASFASLPRAEKLLIYIEFLVKKLFLC